MKKPKKTKRGRERTKSSGGAATPSDPIDAVRRALELVAPTSHRPERIEPLERAVKIVTGKVPRGRLLP